jgi:hypothetical protein
MSQEVPKWMCTAERIATGNRRRVLENGPDTWHSDDEAIKDVVPDEEHGMYTAEMDPKKGPMKISQREPARQRAAADALKAAEAQTAAGSSDSDDPDGPDMVWSHSLQNFRRNKAKILTDSDLGNSVVPSRQLSPIATIPRVSSPEPTHQDTLSSDDDWSWMSEKQREKAEVAKKVMAERNTKALQPPRCLSAPETKAPKKSPPAQSSEDVGKPVTRSRAVTGPSSSPQNSEPTKGPVRKATAAAQPALLAPELLPEAKAPLKLLKGQESPRSETAKKPAPDSHPMATRRQRQASGAGCLRPGGGSGQTDTCVVLYNPSKT